MYALTSSQVPHSSKNSAPLIIRHPFAELGQKTSIFGKGIPKYFQI